MRFNRTNDYKSDVLTGSEQHELMGWDCALISFNLVFSVVGSVSLKHLCKA